MAELGRRMFFTAAGALATVTAVGTHAFASGHARDARTADEYVDVQLLNITDLHGYLQAAPASNAVITGAGGKKYTVGGVAYMAAHLERLRAGRANSLFFAPGDLFSGWEFPAESLADEPTIEALNRMGMNFASAGNHEFDKSPAFLSQHMVDGISYPTVDWDNSFVDSAGQRFHGANFAYYSANMVWAKDGRTVLPPYNIEWVDAGRGRRLPVGFIHLTVLGSELMPASYQPGLRSLDQLATADRCAAELKARGVNAIVLSMHDGAVAGGDFNSGTNPSGPAYELALRCSPDIDAIVCGHWHTAFNMMVPDPNGVRRPFVEAGCHGQIINEINLRLDPATGKVIRELTTSTNHPNTRDVAPHPELAEVVKYWAGYGTRRAAVPLGKQTASFTRTRNEAGESTMGDLVADWALWAGRQPQGPMNDANLDPPTPADLAVIAIAPRLGQAIIAGDLVYDAATDGTVAFGKAWNAVGFGDPIVTATVTGQQIHDALEQQWTVPVGGGLKYAPLAVSANVRYSFDATGPAGNRVDPADVLIDGRPLDVSRSYRIAAPSYTLLNQDGYPAFTGFAQPFRHNRDFESFVAYVKERGRIEPAPLNRVTVKNGGVTGARIGEIHAPERLRSAAGVVLPRAEAAALAANRPTAEGFRVPC
ncbi:5'-nucleotidase [Streptomyces rimosus subsp. rimosus]|uniref:Bifunctional metallophosphatase/5'-nucleotidase n=3 Tax=Streptomyces TaxID=1883 RepID=A0A8A1V155_STRR1|nr:MULTISPECIES: bifunctional metallophosphatase/5'-nucleotidase [Streptomyces]KOG72657.1 5'-nucleotidase [Kitasatospora aureofaciens]MYT47186.1 bifunctional metallophosphatase/5'-nucleotidase [Streptomyces sp. SID5471]KEF07042.1 5'-nucleotidase [Streptomyces rimosus]KEF22081.1 5'-nucleotidase [Streptomyces rimosus]KOT35460.1 5'-nucleotidase [Streptomyces sp. NRRL WC-3701]